MKTTNTLPLLPLLALAFAAGCTPPAPAAAPGGGPAVAPGHFVRRTGGSNTIDALVSGNEVTGAELSFTRYLDASDHAIRGQLSNQPIDLAVTNERASGLVGTSPFDITAEERGDKLHVEGMIRGQTSGFDFNAQMIDGRVGQCDYHLTWRPESNSYRGSRGCGGGGAAEVEVPKALIAWSNAELGAALGLLLSIP